MFENDYFEDVKPTGPGKSGRVVGGVGMWGLHLAAVAFALYSGYHGISATAAYRADSGLGMAAGIVGIVVIELVLLSLYLAWHNGRITGAAQSLAAGVTASVGFILACLGIVADSQLQAGVPLSSWLSAYLTWGLPIAPALMALGALLTHELAPFLIRADDQLCADGAGCAANPRTGPGPTAGAARKQRTGRGGRTPIHGAYRHHAGGA